MSVKITKIMADQRETAPAEDKWAQFKRMLALVRPHKRSIVIGMVAGAIMAVFYSVSIGGVLPVVKTLFTPEGLHGWVDREVAQSRLGVKIEAGGATIDRQASTNAAVRIDQVSEDSPLDAQKDDAIVSINGEKLERGELLRRIAHAPPGQEITLGVVGESLETNEGARQKTITLDPLSTRTRWMRDAAGLLPRETKPGDRLKTLAIILGAVCISVLLTNVFRFIAQYYISRGILLAMMDLRRTLYDSVLALPMSFFARDAADLISRFVQDVQEVQRGLIAFFDKLFREPLKAIFVLIVALLADWRTTIALVIVGPIAGIIFWAVGRKMRKANQRLLRGYGVMIDAVETSIASITVVKAECMESLERQRLWGIDQGVFKHQFRLVKLEAMLIPMLEVLAVVGVSGATMWLGQRVDRQEMDASKFIFLVVILATLFDPVRKLGEVYSRVMRSTAGAERLFSVIDMPGESQQASQLIDAAPPIELPPIHDRIVYEGVRLTYPGAETPALNGLDLTIARGECIAVVGPNGSGKTTLARMLLRFYNPDAGTVSIDGIDLQRVTLHSLRRQIASVTQDPIIFAMSMADNIAYGSPDATPEQVIDAGRRAYADEFIRAIPDAYDAVAGQRGMTLSGGQRQRICIARAILRNAPILILDEATSQIDSESEQKIQQAMRDFVRGRTTIIIAHRLSTIRFADRIIVLDAGQAIDTGTHEELLERCTLYHGLCETQFVD